MSDKDCPRCGGSGMVEGEAIAGVQPTDNSGSQTDNPQPPGVKEGAATTGKIPCPDCYETS